MQAHPLFNLCNLGNLWIITRKFSRNGVEWRWPNDSKRIFKQH